LKLAGELGSNCPELLHSTIAVCAPVDLEETATLLTYPINRLYNRYYMLQLERQARRWTQGRPFSTIHEFDCLVTVPLWGFEDVTDYYRRCSSRFFLPQIKHTCHLLFSCDDPFVNYRSSLSEVLHPKVKVWLVPYGGHMGFFGWADNEHKYYWMDSLLLKWVQDDFSHSEKCS
jgi:uncharacterized protein